MFRCNRVAKTMPLRLSSTRSELCPESTKRQSSSAWSANERREALYDTYRSLTRREREVMSLVIAGLLNKQVGGELGISEITVKAHRGKMMRKMQARSVPDLVRMACRLGLAEA